MQERFSQWSPQYSEKGWWESVELLVKAMAGELVDTYRQYICKLLPIIDAGLCE